MSAALEPPLPTHVEVPEGVLRVCADPNNMPFSNRREEGFENAIARLVARATHRRLQYTWWPQRRGFERHTLRAGLCDVVLGVPVGYPMTDNTRPYYRSTYVFVTRASRPHPVSFDDPLLRELRIGISTIGDDYANPPPAQALAARGLAPNVRGYSVYGDYARAAPQRALIDAVASDDIDVAIAWGPMAGYFARHATRPMAVTLAPDVGDPAGLAMTFAVAMGVRHGDDALRDELDRALRRLRTEIHRVLLDYGVPLLPTGAMAAVAPPKKQRG